MPDAISAQQWATLPSVAVIVLNYNTKEHLAACFTSLQQLIYPADRLELILVDNASTDQSIDYMAVNFSNVRLVKNKNNVGFSRGNNIGVENTDHELVAFLNPDMKVEPEWLLNLVSTLQTAADVAAVGSKILSWDGQNIDFAGGAANFYGYGYQVGLGQPAKTYDGQPEPTLFACGGAMLIRRQVFVEAGGFDDDYFAYYEDLDLGWRLWVLGYRVLFAPQAVAYHVHHGAWGQVNQEKRRVLYERNALFTLLKNYDEAHLNRILPVALMLLIKRIHVAAGIDESLFRLNSPARPVAAKNGAPPPCPGPAQQYGPAYYLQEFWRTLTGAGLPALYRKTVDELQRRYQARQRAQKPGVMEINPENPDQAVIPKHALSYVVAGNDFITLYEKMLQKRAKIQARRRRSDQEILPLFGRPFGVSELWSDYVQTQNWLIHLFKLDEIFGNTSKS